MLSIPSPKQTIYQGLVYFLCSLISERSRTIASFILCSLAPSFLQAQISITGIDAPYTQDFNTLASSGTSSVMPAGWHFDESGAGANTTYAAGNGSSSTNNTYSFGTTGQTDRALGQIDGTTVTTTFGAQFSNNTGATITKLLIQYVGEQWRLGEITALDKLDFQYSTNATAIDDAGAAWIDVTALDFTSPINSGATGALDGNAAANRIQKGSIINGLSIANNAVFWIRWNSYDAFDAEDGLAIDEFLISANPPTHYTITVASGVMTVMDIDGNAEALYIDQVSSNMRIFATGRTYTLNAGSTFAFPFTIAIAGITAATVSVGNGDDTIDVGSFSTTIPSLTLNGNAGNDLIEFNGDIVFQSGANLNVDLQNDEVSPGTDIITVSANVDLQMNGTGTITYKASKNILINAGATVETEAGTITMEANQQAGASSGAFKGIMIAGLIHASTTGGIILRGKGGNTGTNNDGIAVTSSGVVHGSSTSTMILDGRGGPSSSNTNRGIVLEGDVFTDGAHLALDGVGGGIGASSANYGIYIGNVDVTAATPGNIFIEGDGGTTSGSSNYGVYLASTTGKIIAYDGHVEVDGSGGSGGGAGSGSNYGVYVAGEISAQSNGNVTVTGYGAHGSGNNNFGVMVTGIAGVIASSSGNTTVHGIGGGINASSNDYGVYLINGGSISAGVDGIVAVEGEGGNSTGANNHGVYVNSGGASIHSFDNDVNITGYGGGTGTSANNMGVYVIDGELAAGGTGDLNILGYGGQGTGSSNVGVRFYGASAVITTGSGNLFITGETGLGTTGWGFQHSNSASITTAVNGGNITIAANSMDIAGTIAANAASYIQLLTYNQVDIEIGTAGDAVNGPLRLSDAELDFTTAGTLAIGGFNSGDISVTADITRTSAVKIELTSLGNIMFTAGQINTNGGELKVNPGNSPLSTSAPKSGVDATCSLLNSQGPMSFVINGLTADVNYTQLNVVGSVSLFGTALILSGTHSPQPGQTFTIIQNDGADPVAGTFTGYPQNAAIESFLGSPYPASISYTGGTGNDVVITVASPHYLVSTSGGNLVVTDIAGNNDNIFINHNAPNINIAAVTRTYSLNGAAVVNFPMNLPLAGINAITMNAGAGDDIINLNAFSVNMPGITLNGGSDDDMVLLLGDITFNADQSLDIDLQNDAADPGTDVVRFQLNPDLLFSGTGGLTVKASQSVYLEATTTVQTEHGSILIEGNMQPVSTSINNDGVVIDNSILQSTGSGDITLRGRGCTSATSQTSGVEVINGSDLIGGAGGQILIEGTGGGGTYNGNVGVIISSFGTSITTAGAEVNIIGNGGGVDPYINNAGVQINTGAVISVGSEGGITILGTSGATSGNANIGCSVTNTGTAISTLAGPLSITGISQANGVGNSNYGLAIGLGANIFTSGGGQIFLEGYGGNGTGISATNTGLVISDANTAVYTLNSDISLIGIGGSSVAGGGNGGVSIYGNASVIAGAGGSIDLYGAGGTGATGSNNGVLLHQNGNLTTIDGNIFIDALGGDGGNNNFGLNMQNGGFVQSGADGNIYVNAYGGTGTGSDQKGLYMTGATSRIGSSGGDVFVNGYGGDNGINGGNSGIMITGGGIIEATASGNVYLEGIGGYSGLSANPGLQMWTSSSVIRTDNGNINILAAGGGSATCNYSPGLSLKTGGQIYTTGNGDIEINAQGAAGSGNNHYGIEMTQSNSSITTSNGDINIIAQGGGVGASADNHGLCMSHTAKISASGNGIVNITAMTGAADNGGKGIWLNETGTYISTVNGDLLLTGEANTAPNGIQQYGIQLTNGADILSTGAGNLNLAGLADNSDNTNTFGIYIASNLSQINSNGGDIVLAGVEGPGTSSIGIFLDGPVSTESNGGDIELHTNSLYINNPVKTQPAFSTLIRPYTTNDIEVLAAVGEIAQGPVRLYEGELDYITTGTLILGGGSTQNILVDNTITRSAGTQMQLLASEDITFNNGSVQTNGGDLLIQTGDLPFVFSPVRSGTDATVDVLTLDGNLAITINGATPDLTYTQLKVTGNVALNNASLVLSGTYVPTAGTTFVLIDNDGTDPVSGTFAGLPEGHVFPAFNGGSLPAVLSYAGGTGNDVVLTIGAPHYSVTTTNNHLIITDLAGNSETALVSNVAASLRFNVPGRTYTLNGNAVTALPVDIPISDLTAITINVAGGNDGVDMTSFTTQLPNLTINGGTGSDLVSLSGDVTFQTNANVDFDLQNDHATPGVDQVSWMNDANWNLSGTGNITVRTSRAVSMAAGSSLVAVDGQILIEANQQPTPTGGPFVGINLTNSVLQVTGLGIITLTGKGGTSGQFQHGIQLNDAEVKAGEAGSLSLTGRGGASAGTINLGIYAINNSLIESTGANISLTGTGGGTGASAGNSGIGIYNSTVNAQNNGRIEINGLSGTTTGGQNLGFGADHAIITTENANISLSGTANSVTTACCNYGMQLSNTHCVAGGTGNLTVYGIAGTGGSNSNIGIFLVGAETVLSTQGGNVVMNGFGNAQGAAGLSHGVYMDQGAMVAAGGLGDVVVIGQGAVTGTGAHNVGVSIGFSGSTITSAGGDVTVTGTGGGSGASGFNYGVLLNSNAFISAGGDGDVTVTGTSGTPTGNANIGVHATGANTGIFSTNGNVTVQGFSQSTGAGTGNNGISIISGSFIEAGGEGDLTLEGHGSLTSGNSNYGVLLGGLLANFESHNGDISITGFGGSGGTANSSFGVVNASTGAIVCTGTGDVAITGYGGTGSGNGHVGVSIQATGAKVITTDGDVDVTGYGGGSGNAFGNIGVQVTNGGLIAAGGSGSTNVHGVGGHTSGGSSTGVLLFGANSIITSDDGDVSVTGEGGGLLNSGASSSPGVYVSTGGRITAATGRDVHISATGGKGNGGNNIGMYLYNAGNVFSQNGHIEIDCIEGNGAGSFGLFTLIDGFINASESGHVAIQSNSMSLSAAITTSPADTVFIKPVDAGIPIVFANTDVAGGPLRLSDGELDYIQTGTLIIGGLACDSIDIAQPMTPADVMDVHLITGDDIIFSTGSFRVNGGDLYLHGGAVPNAIRPMTPGTDVISDSLVMASQLNVIINGPVVDTDYTQLNVEGKVDLNNMVLDVTGNYPLQGDEVFILVNNDGTDPVISTFAGMAEGHTIHNFLGSDFDATITYAGHDGNDVVIALVNPCVLPAVPAITSSLDTICEGTQVQLSITSGNLGGATGWHWYANTCGGISIGTGTSIDVTPGATTTYFARGEGGCVTAGDCGETAVVVNPFPDPSISHDAPGPCYYTQNVFHPQADPISGATYNWNFGAGAQPASASGYGPHEVIYTTPGSKTVRLVIYPNASGIQCPDSASMSFTINNCPGQVLGKVISTSGLPINNVNVKLFADDDADGLPDTTMHIRSVFTPSNGQFAMATLIPGNYVLVETQPNLWLSHDDDDTSPDGDLVANVDSLDNIIPVTVLPNEFDSNNVFIERPVPGTITGVVFQDLNLNQLPDAGEGISDVNISLFADANANGVADNGNVIATAITNAMGQYSMPEIPVGHYVIVEATPSGMTSIKDFDPTPDGDVAPNANQNNDTLPVSLINAEVDAQNFFIDATAGCSLMVTNSGDSGPGTLRHILGCALAGDTIQFHPSLTNDTIEITSDPLVINTDLIIHGALPSVAIRSSINDLFIVSSGVITEIRNVSIVSGLSPNGAGAAIDNHGQLILHNTQLFANPLLAVDEYLIRNHPGAHLEFSGNIIVFQ